MKSAYNFFLDDICAQLQAGKTILYPTETVWGLGCDAHDGAAVERIFDIKRRSEEKKFVLLVSSIDMLRRYVRQVPQKALKLIDHYEKPLTIVYDMLPACGLAPILHNDEQTIAIRLTRDAFCAEMVERFGRAIVSTSANLSGEPFPEQYSDIPSAITSSVDFIAPYRQTERAQFPPSAIVRVIDGEDLIFIRK